jgi:hypothetical protein
VEVQPPPTPSPSAAPARLAPADDDLDYGGPPEVIDLALGDGIPDIAGEHEEMDPHAMDEE